MANKYLLIEDVEALGRSGDVVNARPGYARNFLLPRGFAVVADNHTIRMQARLQEERQKKALVERKESEEMASRLQDVTLTTIVKVDHDGHMYGSVSSADIVHLLQDQAAVALERRMIALKHPIKEVGVHTIHAKLKEGITATFTLKIEAEEVQQPSTKAAS